MSPIQVLPAFGQIAPRGYISMVLAFPFDATQATAREAITHIRSAHDRVVAIQPLLHAQVHLDKTTGLVHVSHQPGKAALFAERSLSTLGADFPSDYQSLKDGGFAPKHFISGHHTVWFDTLIEKGVAPASALEWTFIDGGLLLWAHVHHSLADGESFAKFLGWLAGETCGVAVPDVEMSFWPAGSLAAKDVNLSMARVLEMAAEEYVKPRSEFPLSLDAKKPQCPLINAGVLDIFVFKVTTLQAIALAVASDGGTDETSGKPPSTFAVLAALAWLHMTRARLAFEGGPVPEMGTIHHPMNWRNRFFVPEGRNYFGNATVVPLTHCRIAEFLPTNSFERPACRLDEKISLHPAQACSSKGAVSSPPISDVCNQTSNQAANCQSIQLSDLPSNFPKLVGLITRSLSSINAEAIALRTALTEQAIRHGIALGLNVNTAKTTNLWFNTWRSFGADDIWSIPGVGMRKPDAIRKNCHEQAPGAGLIMPASRESEELELVVCLAEGSMQKLEKDREWMKWVVRMVQG